MASFSLWRTAAQCLTRPQLLVLLMGAAWRFRRREWYRHAPFLPLPPEDYMRWRLHTAFGDERAQPDVHQLEAYLRWTRIQTLERGNDVTKKRSNEETKQRRNEATENMIKYVIIVICLVGATFYVPSMRARVLPVFQPVLNHLGPVGDKMSGPSKKWAARNEMNILLRKLAEDHAEHKELPNPMNFQIWIKKNTRAGKKGLDPWDHPYYLVHSARQVTVGSQGPDRVRNTPDDIRVSAPID